MRSSAALRKLSVLADDGREIKSKERSECREQSISLNDTARLQAEDIAQNPSLSYYGLCSGLLGC